MLITWNPDSFRARSLLNKNKSLNIRDLLAPLKTSLSHQTNAILRAVSDYFFPEVEIIISSDDTYEPTTVRADQTYSVSVNVSGMLDAGVDENGNPISDDLKTVLVSRGYREYSMEPSFHYLEAPN